MTDITDLRASTDKCLRMDSQSIKVKKKSQLIYIGGHSILEQQKEYGPNLHGEKYR